MRRPRAAAIASCSTRNARSHVSAITAALRLVSWILERWTPSRNSNQRMVYRRQGFRMPRRGRLSTKHCSYTANVSVAATHRLFIAVFAVVCFVGSAAAQPQTATFEKGLDAYFGEQPARAVTML